MTVVSDAYAAWYASKRKRALALGGVRQLESLRGYRGLLQQAVRDRSGPVVERLRRERTDLIDEAARLHMLAEKQQRWRAAEEQANA